jgi:plastocyanin
MKRWSVLLLLPLTLACNDREVTDPGTVPNSVTVQATATNNFTPQVAEVAVNGTVTWVFQAVEHNVIFDDVAGKPADIPARSSAQEARIFATAGTYPYSCSIHPGMIGSIIVRQ